MAEPFKNMFRAETLGTLAEWLQRGGTFDAAGFHAAACRGLEPLELKDRVRHVATVLVDFLPATFPDAAAHIVASLPPPLAATEGSTDGFLAWPLCQYVQEQGLDQPEHALPALYELTRRFTAEFAIRPFLLRDPAQVLARLASWTADPDPHVRRLVSEGTRPRLPWGLRLEPFVQDPRPLLPLLEALRDDPEEVVRRSVANHLNDITKDHPALVVEICGRWLAEAPDSASPRDRDRLVRHALRGLVKQGHPAALALLGVGPPQVRLRSFTGPARARIGDSPRLELHLHSTADRTQRLVLDYRLEMPGAGGRTNRKVFKWSTRSLAAGAELHLGKAHSLVPVSTRQTRPGLHRFVLQVNGQDLGSHELWVEAGADDDPAALSAAATAGRSGR